MCDEPSAVGASDCCFCRDLRRHNAPVVIGRNSFVNKPCRDTAHFAAFPSLSPLVAGHTLIIPKYHVTSMAQVGPPHRLELTDFVQSVSRVIAEVFGHVVLFEHGVAAGAAGGCGVTHAHFHLLPLQGNVARNVSARLQDELGPAAPCDLASLLGDTASSDSYVLFGCPRGPFLRFLTSSAPSQYLRRVIAQEAGRVKWDWREYFGWTEFEDTRAVLLSGAN